MTKKILLSVVASALLTTSAFAGTVIFPTGHTTITTESLQQNGMDLLDFGQIVYNAGDDPENNNNFSEQERQGGSVSDPMVAFDISNLEFEFHQDGLDVKPGFDAHGKGLTPLEMQTILGQDDLVNTLLEDAVFKDTILADVDDLTISVADFDQINFENGKAFAQYDGDSSTEVKNQHSYVISDGTVNPVSISVKAIKDRANDVEVTLYSQTLDENVIDKAAYDASTLVAPQFKVACVRKFDGLINFENDRVSFVNPEHGERIGNVPADTTNDTLITSDRMIFTINNNRDDTVDTRWMGGHGTQFTFTASNNDNAFENWTDSTVKVYTTDSANVDTDNAALTAADFTYKLAVGTKLTALPASFVFDAVTNEFVITYENALLPTGTTSFVVDLIKPEGEEPLRAVEFLDPIADLEGGLALDDVTVNGADANHGSANHAVVNTTDSSDLIAPAIASDSNITTAGKWMDHAFIAQIAGGSVTKYDDADTGMQTKLFIVNRSCVTATPVINLVMGGKLIPLTGLDPIEPNQQGFIDIGEVLHDMGMDVSGFDYARFGFEVTLSGVAEDFYMYAQVKNIAINQFKDLPVYTTSNRD